jgi:cell division protein FtsQ
VKKTIKRREKVEAPEPQKRNRRVRAKAEVHIQVEPGPSMRDRARERYLAAAELAQRLRKPAEIVFRSVLVIAIGAGAIALGRLVERHVRTSPAFALREIEVDGHVRITEAEILETAGVAMGRNVFDVSPEDAQQRLSEHAWIDEARVERRLPGTLRIHVRERRPVALVALPEVYLVAEDGAVFKRVENDDPVDLPVITGIDRGRFTRDRGFRTSILLECVALLHDYRAAGLSGREEIGEVHVESDDGLSLYVGEDSLYVRLGHGPFRAKLRRLRTVEEELERRGARAAYVYLDNERRPDRVTVRIRESVSPSASIAVSPPSEPL